MALVVHSCPTSVFMFELSPSLLLNQCSGKDIALLGGAPPNTTVVTASDSYCAYLWGSASCVPEDEPVNTT